MANIYPIPYKAQLESTLVAGQTLVLRGLITGNRFDVNLIAGGNTESDDKVLHLSFRQNENAVVANNSQGGQWQKEERLKSPLKANDQFDVRIRIEKDGYKVLINHADAGTIKHRSPVSDVTYLAVSGDLELRTVGWGGGYYTVPYVTTLAGGIEQGRRLIITGLPNKSANRFAINLKARNDDIPLHIDVRFDESKVVLNTKENNAWNQTEVRANLGSLKRDNVFDLIIENSRDGYILTVDDAELVTFSHRLQSSIISKLEVTGDVELLGLYAR